MAIFVLSNLAEYEYGIYSKQENWIFVFEYEIFGGYYSNIRIYEYIRVTLTEDYQVFKQELTNNGDETTIISNTDSNNKINELDRETEASESKCTEMEDILQPQKKNYKEGDNLQDNIFLDDATILLYNFKSKTKTALKTQKQLDTKQNHACQQ